MDQKKKVIALLAQPRADKYELFNECLEHYKQSPNKIESYVARLNRIGFSDSALENLIFELKKVYFISDSEIAEAMTLQLSEKNIEEEFNFKQKNFEINRNILLELGFDLLESDTLFVKEDVSITVQELYEIDAFAFTQFLANNNLDLKDPAHTEVVDSEVVHPVSQSQDTIALREEFPFLNDKNCPAIMYVVVGKRIAAYNRYKELHAKIQQFNEGTLELSEQEQSNLAIETQEANAENILLWEELKYYQENGKVLGKHPLFKEEVAKQEVEAMTSADLTKFLNSSATFLSRKNKELKDPKNIDKVAEIKEAIALREYKLSLVKTKLGIKDGE